MEPRASAHPQLAMSKMKAPAAAPASSHDLAQNRAALRDLRSKLQNQREELTAVNSNALADVQCKANDMFGVSKQEARSAALDAGLLHDVSRLGAEQAGKLDKQSPEEFVKRLLGKYGMGGGADGRQKLNFAVLSHDLQSNCVFRTVPAITFLLDSSWAPAAPKAKKERQKRKHTTEAPQETAETVQVDDLQEQAQSKAQNSRMETMLKVIQKHAGASVGGTPVNLFRLLLHPTSFSQTVENFFDLAFLVKDGRVGIETKERDGSTHAFVKPTKPPESDQFAQGLLKVQNIVKLDYDTWEKLVAKWCADGEPYLKDRSGGAVRSKGSSSSQRGASSSQDASEAGPSQKTQRR